MRKIIGLGLFLCAVWMLSGCATPIKSTEVSLAGMTGGIIRSDDGGKTYKPVVRVGEKGTLSGVQTLVVAMDRGDTKKMYLGSLEDGIFITHDGGENWEQSTVPIQKNYALVIHPADFNTAYVTGVYNGRGKIAKTVDGGKTWNEVYTEPADGTVILSLSIQKNAPEKVYAGTSEGTLIVTQDGGATWANSFKAENPIRALSVDPHDGNTLYAMTFQDSVLLSRDGGKTFMDMAEGWEKYQESKLESCRKDEKCSLQRVDLGSVYSFALDSQVRGKGYLGTNKGLFRFSHYGESWEEVNIISSSKAFPLSSVAVNPQNSGEIYYSSAQAIYRTVDEGLTWFPFQLESDTVSVSAIVFDEKNPGVVYAGLRKEGK